MVEVLGNFFGEPKISEFDITLEVYEDIFRFEVAVYYAPRVNMTDCPLDHRRVKPGLGTRYAVFLAGLGV